MFLTMFFKTQNIAQTMHLTMLIAHTYLTKTGKWQVKGKVSYQDLGWRLRWGHLKGWPLVVGQVELMGALVIP